jgi:hypothetical protein
MNWILYVILLASFALMIGGGYRLGQERQAKKVRDLLDNLPEPVIVADVGQPFRVTIDGRPISLVITTVYHRSEGVTVEAIDFEQFQRRYTKEGY